MLILFVLLVAVCISDPVETYFNKEQPSDSAVIKLSDSDIRQIIGVDATDTQCRHARRKFQGLCDNRSDAAAMTAITESLAGITDIYPAIVIQRTRVEDTPCIILWPKGVPDEAITCIVVDTDSAVGIRSR